MPDCGAWWFDHVGHTYLYAVAARERDLARQAEEAERLVDGADEWERLAGAPGAGRLMTGHVAAVKALADATFLGDAAAIEGSLQSLMDNAEEQTALYRSAIPGFPDAEWKERFTGLGMATAAYVLALAVGDGEDFKRNLGNAHRERNALARLWTLVGARRSLG